MKRYWGCGTLTVVLTGIIATMALALESGKWSPDQIAHTALGEKLLRYRSQIPLMLQDPKLPAAQVLRDFQQKIETLASNSIRVTSSGGQGSASFISEYGLVATNDHVVSGCLDDHDSHRINGFVANSYERWGGKNYIEGLLCKKDTGFRMAVFKKRLDISDTKEIPPDIQAECDAYQERAELRRESLLDKAPNISLPNVGKACTTVTMNNGSTYFDVYDVYFDFRLVFIAPTTLAGFAFDQQNFQWMPSRGHLDVALGRLYDEDGQPVRVVNPLKVNASKLQEKQFVMSLGYPGGTERFLTLAEYDGKTEELAFAGAVAHFNVRQILKRAVADGSYANDEVKTNIKAQQNGAVGLEYAGQQMPLYRQDIQEREHETLAYLKSLAEKGDPLAVDQLQAFAAMAAYLPVAHARSMADKIHGFFSQSKIINLARQILTHFETPETAIALAEITATAAALDMNEERELLNLAYSWARKVFARGEAAGLPQFDHSVWPKDLFKGDGIFDQTDPKEFSQALQGFLSSGVSLKDLDDYPFIQVVRLLRQHRTASLAPSLKLAINSEQNRPLIHQAQLRYQGQLAKPCLSGNCQDDSTHLRFMSAADASSTLRFTFGTIEKVIQGNQTFDCFSSAQAVCTEYREALNRKAIEGDKFFDFADYDLPPEVVRCLEKCNSHLNFISTLDTSGGASGSLTLNGAGEFIGVVFDGNPASVAADYGDGPRQQQAARTIHVSAEYLFEYIALAFPEPAKVLFEELDLP